MSASWLDASEVVAGLVLVGRLSPHAVNSRIIHPPYDRMMRAVQSAKKPSSDSLINLMGISAHNAALMAAETIKGDPLQWVDFMEKAHHRADAAIRLERVVQQLKTGQDVDLLPVQNILQELHRPEGRMVSMDKVKSDPVQMVPTGWDVLDDAVGGLPKVGLTLVAGPPGTGKTTFAGKLVARWVRKHKKPVGLFSLEMTTGQVVTRMREIEELPQKLEKLVYIGDSVSSPEDMVTVATSTTDFSLVIVDFAELLLPGEVSEPIMSGAYRSLAYYARSKRIPLVSLAQLSRMYTGDGIPRLTHIRYSGVGEQMTALGILLHNPDQIFVSRGDAGASLLPAVPGAAWMIFAKSRWGYKAGGTGAALVEFRAQAGWGDKMLQWKSLSESKAVAGVAPAKRGTRA